MGDDKDREYLYSLPELDRENILEQRYQKRQELKERYMIKKRLQKQDKTDRDFGSKGTRTSQRTKGDQKSSKASALNDLKKKRAKHYSDQPSSEEEEEEEEAKESDDDYRVEEMKRIPEKMEEVRITEPSEDEETSPPMDYSDLKDLCLRRDFLEKTIEEPYFDTRIPGFFVRVGIGVDSKGDSTYRVAQIISIDTLPGKPAYKLGKKKTNKYAKLKHGQHTKTFSMDVISNTRVSEAEFQKWTREMLKSSLPLLTKQEVEEKKIELKNIQNYSYSEKEIMEMVEAKKKELKKPINYAAERVRLLTLLGKYEDSKDEENIQKCQQELQELDRNKGDQTKDKQAQINERNLKFNMSRSDIKQEKVVVNPDLDPFSRRQTKPMALHRIVDPEEEMKRKLEEEKKKEEEKVKKEEEKKRKQSAEDLLDPETLLKQAHNFDLELDTQVAPVKEEEEKPKLKEPKPNKQKRPTLSLMEYKKKMGLL